MLNKDMQEIDWLPEKKLRELFLMGGILPVNELPLVCSQVTQLLYYTSRKLREEGFQIVGLPQLVPGGEDELLALRIVIHYVGEEEAVQHPSILPSELPNGMIYDELDPRILKALNYAQVRWDRDIELEKSLKVFDHAE